MPRVSEHLDAVLPVHDQGVIGNPNRLGRVLQPNRIQLVLEPRLQPGENALRTGTAVEAIKGKYK